MGAKGVAMMMFCGWRRQCILVMVNRYLICHRFVDRGREGVRFMYTWGLPDGGCSRACFDEAIRVENEFYATPCHNYQHMRDASIKRLSH